MFWKLSRDRRFYLVRGLLICALISLCVMIPITVSRYVSQSEAQDSATVAEFDISQEGVLSKPLNVRFGAIKEEDYRIKLTNKSDVAVRYTVKINQETDNLPLIFIWDDGQGVCEGMLTYGDQVTRMLTVTWDENQKDYSYSGQIDRITVSVICEQID